MTREYSGSCLCGAVVFSVTGFSKGVENCHCTMCRKFHGAAYATLVGVSGLRWHKGEGFLQHFTADNGSTRTFCQTCGSSIGFRVKGDPLEKIELAISTFDEEIPVKVDAQIFTSFKANWCQLQSDLPAFAEGRESAQS